MSSKINLSGHELIKYSVKLNTQFLNKHLHIVHSETEGLKCFIVKNNGKVFPLKGDRIFGLPKQKSPPKDFFYSCYAYLSKGNVSAHIYSRINGGMWRTPGVDGLDECYMKEGGGGPYVSYNTKTGEAKAGYERGTRETRDCLDPKCATSQTHPMNVEARRPQPQREGEGGCMIL